MSRTFKVAAVSVLTFVVVFAVVAGVIRGGGSGKQVADASRLVTPASSHAVTAARTPASAAPKSIAAPATAATPAASPGAAQAPAASAVKVEVQPKLQPARSTPPAAVLAPAPPPQPAASTPAPQPPPPPPPPAPSPAASCYPLTNAGACFRAGEFCPIQDHGMYGVGALGRAIVCQDVNGWRWELA